jgi:hypothetical protein
MKRKSSSFVSLIGFIIVLITVGMTLRAQTPSEDIAVKVKTMWQAKQLNDLRSYLGSVENAYPDFAPAIAAAAFYDFIFCGKLNGAKAKLERLKAASDSNPGAYSDDFRNSLHASIRTVSDESRIQTAHGKSENDLGRNANPQAIRNAWSEHHLPLLDVLTASPKVSITGN